MYGEDKCFSVLTRMRNLLTKVGSKSCTSITYQNAIAQYLFDNALQGGTIIEVGCYLGGLTAQLAFIAKVTGAILYTIDINPEYVSHTRELLGSLNLNTNTQYYCGTLDSFTGSTKFTSKPLLLVIDGDHRYESVLKDIRSIYNFNLVPRAVAFHDFSLRYVEKFNTFVDRAIFDSFGSDVELMRIGEQVDASSSLPRRANPHMEGYYWEENGSEGVILFPPDGLFPSFRGTI